MYITKREKGQNWSKFLSKPMLFVSKGATLNISFMYTYTYRQICTRIAKHYFSEPPLKTRAKTEKENPLGASKPVTMVDRTQLHMQIGSGKDCAKTAAHNT